MSEINLGAEIVGCGLVHDANDTEHYKEISREVDELSTKLGGAVRHLKTELSTLKSKYPEGNTVDEKGELKKDNTYDLSKYHKLISEFQKVHNDHLIARGEEPDAPFTEEELKTYSKVDLEKLLSHIGNMESDLKAELQKITHEMFRDFNLNLAKFEALNRTLQAYLRGLERRAQQLKGQ